MTDMGQVPAHLMQSSRARVLQDVTAGLGATRPAHISIRGGKFRLVNAAGAEYMVPTHHLDVIIIGAQYNASRVYYGQAYDPNDPAPPVCWSDNGTGPSVNSLEPQAPTCAICPWNDRGSATTFNGKPTTACTKKKKLACIVPGDPAVNVYELQVPIASLSQLRQYHDWISQQSVPGLDRQLDVADVVTRLGWAADKNFQLTFAPVGWTDERSQQVIEYVDINRLMDLPLGRNDVAMAPEKVQALLTNKPTAAPSLPPPAAQAPPQQFTLPPPPAQTLGANPMLPLQGAPPYPQRQSPLPPPPTTMGATAPAGLTPLPLPQGQPVPFPNGGPPLTISDVAAMTAAGTPSLAAAKRTRGPNKPKTIAPSPQSTLQAPSMQHSEQFAASQSAPSWATPQPVQQPQQHWEQRAPGPRQDAPSPISGVVPPQAASGFMMPPPPPPGIQSALDAAMRLPLPPQG